MKKFFLLTLFIAIFAHQIFADTTYKVQKGDTLFSIARHYQLTINELRVANNLSQSDIIKAGQTLNIPTADITTAATLNQKTTANNATQKTAPATKTASTKVTSNSKNSNKNSFATSAGNNKTPNTKSYTIQKGDTLYGIARKVGVKVSVLLTLNNIDTNSTIKAGQKLLVPLDAIQKTEKKSLALSKEAAQKERLASSKGVVWPLENPRIKNITGKVSGVELTGVSKEEVKSVREGTVMYTGVYRGFGQVIFVQSKTGLIYSYSGLKQVDAKKGDYVTMGSKLGTLGSDGDVNMKFMVFQNGVPLDPISAPRG